MTIQTVRHRTGLHDPALKIHGTRPSRAYLSGSRTTRLLDELIADQLVTKERSPADGRSFYATLTDKGLAALTQAYPVHLGSVRSRVLDHVDKSAMPCFASAVIAIAESLG
jgi:DNA-binding MarR family transcriptional regulator